ncbi:MAG: response regulator [Acetatifactor sp.]|nr:response regulator [Acetatifactor sp.]
MRILIVDDEVAAIKDLQMVVHSVLPSDPIDTADNVRLAMDLCAENEYDVIFLDINMPHKDGLTVAKEIKAIRPMANIVMVTAYPQYALDAFKIFASGYILKPAMVEDVREVLNNLRNPVAEETKGLYVQCFGTFEVFYDGQPMKFKRSKAKEMFAYLIDRTGASVTNGELRAILWDDDAEDSDKQRNYLTQIARDLRQTLEEKGLEGVFVQSRNAYSVIPERIPCDYYFAMKKDSKAMAKFDGEYMSQYSWAEMRLGYLNELLSREF